MLFICYFNTTYIYIYIISACEISNIHLCLTVSSNSCINYASIQVGYYYILIFILFNVIYMIPVGEISNIHLCLAVSNNSFLNYSC